MEPLTFKIITDADDSGVVKVQRGMEGMHIGARKASGALRNFSKSLSGASSGADIAAGAAESLAHVVGHSLIGAVAVGGVKLFTDQIDKMGEKVKAVAESASKGFDDIDKAGGSMTLADAQANVRGLEQSIISTQTSLKGLNESPLSRMMSSFFEVNKEVRALEETMQRVRDFELAAGMMTQNINEKRLAGLSEEKKKLEEIEILYNARKKVGQGIKSASAKEEYDTASDEKYLRDKYAEIDRQAKAQRDKQQAYDDEVFAAEIQANIYERKFKENADKEAADRKKADQESAHKEELYNIDEAAKLQDSADKTKFDRMMRDAKFALSEQKRLIEKKKSDFEAQSKLSGGLLGASREGQQVLGVARKTRGRENKQADFKAQEAVFGNLADAENKRRAAQGITTMTTPSEMKKRVAAQQAASEAPSLSDQIQGQMTGVDPSQIASEQVKSRFEKQGIGMASDLGPRTKIGQEAQSQTGDVLKAITSLVDLMKSATLVGN
jgi:hypothetical protein